MLVIQHLSQYDILQKAQCLNHTLIEINVQNAWEVNILRQHWVSTLIGHKASHYQSQSSRKLAYRFVWDGLGVTLLEERGG